MTTIFEIPFAHREHLAALCIGFDKSNESYTAVGTFARPFYLAPRYSDEFE